MKALSESTPVTLGLVISLVGAVIAITTISNKTEANTTDIKRLEIKQDAFMQIREDIAAIKVKVDTIEKRVK